MRSPSRFVFLDLSAQCGRRPSRGLARRGADRPGRAAVAEPKIAGLRIGSYDRPTIQSPPRRRSGPFESKTTCASSKNQLFLNSLMHKVRSGQELSGRAPIKEGNTYRKPRMDELEALAYQGWIFLCSGDQLLARRCRRRCRGKALAPFATTESPRLSWRPVGLSHAATVAV